MLVVLPPSETKFVGGDGPPLRLDALGYPVLHERRQHLLELLVDLAADLPRARTALGTPAGKDGEVLANADLVTAPTMRAALRYTGVLFAALDAPGMTAAQRARADQRLAICSALFGLLRPGDDIPFYRLSAHSKLDGATLAQGWRPSFARLTAQLDGPVVDLRSGAYQAFGEFPGAISVRVVTADAVTGERRVVSHHNKHTKGLLARALALTRAEVTDVRGVVRVARRAGLAAEPTGPAQVQILT